METIAEIEKEIKSLQEEFLSLGKEIKACKDATTRKMLMEEKKQIKSDLDEAKAHLEMLKDISEKEVVEDAEVIEPEKKEIETFSATGETEFEDRVTYEDDNH
jgi:hypothetical protein